jgi:hypothetical protein
MPMQGATLPVAAAHHQPPPVHTGFWHGGGSWHAGHNSWSGSSGHAHPAAAGSNATPVAGWNGTFQGRVARTSLEFHPLVLRVPGVRPHQLVFGSSSQQQQQCIRVSLFGLWQLAVASLLGWSCSSRQQLVGQPSPSPAAGAGPASSACEPRACGAVSRTRVAAVAGALCSAVQCSAPCGAAWCNAVKGKHGHLGYWQAPVHGGGADAGLPPCLHHLKAFAGLTAPCHVQWLCSAACVRYVLQYVPARRLRFACLVAEVVQWLAHH